MNGPRSPLLALLTFLLCHFAQADTGRICRLVFVDRPEDGSKSLHLFDGKKSQEVELPSMNLSPVYKLASGAIQLRLLAAKAEDPKLVPADAPMVEIPADHTDFVLLVFSDPGNKIAPVKLEVVNLDGKTFKVGQTLWFNKTDKTIQGSLGDQALSLEPESSRIIDSPLSDKGDPASGYFSASFTYLAGENGEFAPITEQQWWHDANSRHLGFIMNTGGKLPKIQYYRDFR
jgi:hypothetical protein